MARAKYDSGYCEVVLRLTKDEASALHALLSRVEPETDEQIASDVHDVFYELERVSGHLDLWRHHEFTKVDQALR